MNYKSLLITIFTLFSLTFGLKAQSITITDSNGCFGGFTVNFAGVHNGKNYYNNVGQALCIYWDAVDARWEMDGSNSTPGTNTFIAHVSTVDSSPNPPDLSLGGWTDASGFCGTVTQVDGSGTQSSVGGCTEPDVPSAFNSTPATICDGSDATLTWSGNLNDATAWHIYSGTCGGTLVTTVTGNSAIVTPPSSGETYYVRGEGACASLGACASRFVSVTPIDNASFSYDAPAYCADGLDPVPTVTGNPGGTFSSAPAGLTLNPSDGTIDLDASTAGTYTVTYATAGICPNSADQIVTIADPTVNFAAPADLFTNAGTQTGLGGGTPSGGVYSGPGVTDDGNGMTYSFDPIIADTGIHTLIYTYTDVNSCSGSASDEIEVRFPVAIAAAGCNTYSRTSVSGTDWIHFTDGSGGIVASIRPAGNDLGDVNIEMDDRASVGQDNQGLYYLPRYFNFESTNFDGIGATFPSPVNIRLYYKEAELTDYNTTASTTLGISDLILSHYSGADEDCDITNNQDPTVASIEDITPWAYNYNGSPDFYLEFSVNHFSEIATGNGGLMLPVELNSFSGRIIGKANELQWSTASETNFSHFEIERSSNGLDFRSIGEVQGKGNTADVSQYSYTDPDFFGTQNYYRLKMVDLDRTFEYSSVILLESNLKGDINIYPNPAKENIQIQLNDNVGDNVFYTITSVDGQKVMEGRIDNPNYDLDINPLVKGIYILNVNGEGINETIKLVKE